MNERRKVERREYQHYGKGLARRGAFFIDRRKATQPNAYLVSDEQLRTIYQDERGEWHAPTTTPIGLADELLSAVPEDIHSSAWVQDAIICLRALATKDAEIAALRADSEDAERLDFVEQLLMNNENAELVFDWRFNGKRYSKGLRYAIDAAKEKGK